jgi:thiol-disulfide isomerase/thioredoxin
MAPRFLVLLTLLSAITGAGIKAQDVDSSYMVIEDSSYFVVKGKILNPGFDQWELCLTTYFNNDVWQIPVTSGGFFAKRIPIRGIQDVYLYLNDDTITINAFPGDTIELYWDDKDFKSTFKIGSNNPMRNKDLQMNLKLYKTFREPFSNLSEKLWERKDETDSARFSWINAFCNQMLECIISDSGNHTETTPKFLTDAYYSCMNLLWGNNMAGHISLMINEDSVNRNHSREVSRMLEDGLDNRMISYLNFSRSAQYRVFLEYYAVHNTGLSPEQISQKPLINQYRRCIANVGACVIRDWLVTTTLMRGYEFYPYDDCETVYQDFIGRCNTAIFKDSLINFHDFVRHFKPGELAPDFVLKDTLDHDVSLSDFRGKVVYIDFWGVGCAPCRSDISRYVPQLHEKYKGKDVVFINICVDSDVKTWKKGLSDLKLEGINLIAEGWDDNPVCKSFNIHAIPHYIILDRDGKYVSYNGASPWKLIENTTNELDQALQE